VKDWRLGILTIVLAGACGGTTEETPQAYPAPTPRPEPPPMPEPEPAPAPTAGCDLSPLWTVSPDSYGARRGYLGFSLDGTRLAWSSGQTSPLLREFDSVIGRELERADNDGEWRDLPRNELVDRDASWQRDLVGSYALYVVDTESVADGGVPLAQFYASQPASSCAFFDESAARVFRPMCDSSGPLWQVLSADDGQLVTEFGTNGECTGMTGSQRDGGVLLTLDSQVAYWPVAADLPSALATHEHAAHALGWRGLVGAAIDPAHQRALSVAVDGSVQFYRLPELTLEPSTLSAHVTVANDNLYAPQVVVSPASYSHDGSRLVMAGSPLELEVRESDTLQLLSRLPESDVIALAFSTDDSLLAVASATRLAVYACR
jgi:hypothetical protein